MIAAPMSHVAEPRNWLVALRRYLLFAALANLLWEFFHVPLYTLWLTGTTGELIFAAVHCTGADILITLGTITLALLLFGAPDRPRAHAGSVLAAALLFGVGYTIIIEWLNIELREAWAYRELMPIIPVVNAGLSPILQWVVVPLAAYAFATGWRPWHREAGQIAHA